MKNYLSKISLMVLIALLALSCGKNEVMPEPIWEGATAVLYANIGQMHTKSGLAEMNLTKLEQQLDQNIEEGKEKMATIIKSMLRNPNASGFNLNEPIYFAVGEYVNDENKYNVIASVEVESATTVDDFLKAIAEDFTNANFTIKGNKRIIRIDEEDVIIGYDDNRLVAIGTNDKSCDLQSVLLDHMKYDAADLSRFQGYDLAAYLDINNVYDLTHTLNTNDSNEESDEDVDLFEYFDKKASVITGLSFDQGCITYNANINGVSENISKLFKELNGRSLNRLAASPIALLDIGINGEAFAELANVAIDTTMESLGGASNEFNIYKNIALGVIASINGDLMLSLTDAEGTISENVFGDKQILFTSADALFTANVTDNYIMDNIATYAGAFLTKQDNGYSIEAFGNRLTIAQDDNLFFVGVNNDGKTKQNSAASQEWFSNILGRYAYAMVDFNQLFKSGYGRTALNVMLNGIKNSTEKESATKLISSIDTASITVSGNDETMSGELMIVARDKSKNSLHSIVELYYDIAFN